MTVTSTFSLAGRTALVTGASRGIGRALALGLAQAEADVVVAGRDEQTLALVRDKAEKNSGRRSSSVAMDVSSVDTIAEAFDKLRELGVEPDLLINNAGVEQVSESTDVDEALWARIVDTNLKGAFFVARRFAADLIERGQPGAIVNVCSLTSGVGVPTAAPYTASKSGLLGITRALSAEWASKGIRVNGIGPGYFHTDLTDVFYRDNAWRETMIDKIPMRRFGELDDLVGATVFLCSDAAAYITGQLLYVDGGYMASI